jgi:hypothetical protein
LLKIDGQRRQGCHEYGCEKEARQNIAGVTAAPVNLLLQYVFDAMRQTGLDS